MPRTLRALRGSALLVELARTVEGAVKVTMTVERIYEMDAERVLSESGFDPPTTDATPQERNRWLRETFYELCGFERDEDHVDGSYVKLVNEATDTEFDVW